MLGVFRTSEEVLEEARRLEYPSDNSSCLDNDLVEAAYAPLYVEARGYPGVQRGHA